MAQRLVIIGNGMAAVRLVEQLLARAPARFAITLIGDEPQPAYNRILLSPVLAGEKPAAQTQLHDESWYSRYGVTLLTGERAQAVDLIARTVTTATRTLGWDELVFATGSTPFIPPIEGSALGHVHAFRTLADVDAILATPGPTVVLGGGLLGVEAAAALARQGADVTLIHRHPWLMEQQLDAQAGALLGESLTRAVSALSPTVVSRASRQMPSRCPMAAPLPPHGW
ncbi:Nitrite reductase [NAD(P)H] large subunit [Cronobacter condimenti 1330]|uniref:Nitrite reductase [NAD(P)H] large subunit n=1 Tax=Cronobacter condimenti 1330 TaxID=1073999 RepID=K8A3S9_9ENTR|nr:Nitrite reductase [NAD(P)H] large subunit [Cronobacter condimenti 1330]